MNLKGKVALITGASKGIGRAIALELSKQGVLVALNYSNDDNCALETLDLIKKNNGYAKLFKYDVGNYENAELLVEEVINCFGRLDIVINNAGISKIGLFIDMTEKDWDSTMNVNIKGVFNVTHNAAKHMLKMKTGNIINISSIWGNVGASCEVIYSASKGAINSFTKALAKELAPSNIRVNAIAPGVIETGMNQWLGQEERSALEDEIPMGRFGTAEEVAKLAAFLCSDEAKYLTGQIITIDGGLL
jgi:3-oxoacyl-[acyl-carrier protein] reductase